MAPTSGESAFAAWAPDGVLWSEWAKPVAFVLPSMTMGADSIPQPTQPAALPDFLDPKSVVVVDLPGVDAVHAGLALARRGYRPVPLFNGTSGPSAVIDVSPVTRALWDGAPTLERHTLALDAAPAFLLDSRRNVTAAPIRPGSYDNRWVVLPQDFPSGSLLASRGMRSATVLQTGTVSIAPDLAHVLRRWQESGLQIRVVDVGSGRVAENVTVPKPSGFKLAWYAAIALFGLRRSNVGGFGSLIPEHTGRRGFYG
jgi:hypothetical protein